MRPSLPIAIIGVAALTAFGGYEVLKPEAAVPSTQQESEMKTYTNTKYDYSFQYPSSWHVDERLMEAYREGKQYDAQDVVFLTNLSEAEVTEELNTLSEHQGIASGWEDVAEGRMITIQPELFELDSNTSNEITTWTTEPETVTTSGLTFTRMRYSTDYELPADIHYAYLPYSGTAVLQNRNVLYLNFSIDDEATEADKKTFEEVLKTVSYQ